MALYQIYGWNIARHPTTKNRPAYAHVTLRGRRIAWLKGWVRISETHDVPLPPDDKGDNKSNKALLRTAMGMSTNRWYGSVPM